MCSYGKSVWKAARTDDRSRCLVSYLAIRIFFAALELSWRYNFNWISFGCGCIALYKTANVIKRIRSALVFLFYPVVFFSLVPVVIIEVKNGNRFCIKINNNRYVLLLLLIFLFNLSFFARMDKWWFLYVVPKVLIHTQTGSLFLYTLLSTSCRLIVFSGEITFHNNYGHLLFGIW